MIPYYADARKYFLRARKPGPKLSEELDDEFLKEQFSRGGFHGSMLTHHRTDLIAEGSGAGFSFTARILALTVAPAGRPSRISSGSVGDSARRDSGSVPMI